MNRKVLLIVIIVAAIILLAGGGAAVYFLVIKPQGQTTTTANADGTGTNGANPGGANGRGNFANMRNTTGKVLSISNTDMVVDAGSSQSDVVWDNATRVTGNSVSTQATVLTLGNTVSVSFTANNGINQATKISKIDLTAFAVPSGVPGQSGMSGNGAPSGRVRRNGGNGNGGSGSGGGSSGGNGVVRPSNVPRTSYTGTVTAVNGNTLTITEGGFGGGFNRPAGSGTATQTPSVTPTPTQISFDISTATYYVMETKAVTDIKKGDTVQVTGTLQSNQQVLARSITIE